MRDVWQLEFGPLNPAPCTFDGFAKWLVCRLVEGDGTCAFPVEDLPPYSPGGVARDREVEAIAKTMGATVAWRMEGAVAVLGRKTRP